ncbi:GNAT family N-acetyltransferase [Pseudalkalibacillus sp. Hm43]|uniref:GNAT family N-acetyltransferase n=1 Tax=Pseudalkalibacillus sp. Hm43 TaxID=3450742 RepID=UPI003F42123C
MLKSVKNVQLISYSPIYDKALFSFYLPDEQLRFTAYPEEMIRLAKEDATRHPVIILSEDYPVGFFVLQAGERVEQYTDEKNGLLLIAFSIDTNHQGKGYAKRGLKLLPDYVRTNFPEVREVVLAVNEKNIAAQKLYQSCGFVDHGKRKMGKIGPQQLLTLEI